MPKLDASTVVASALLLLVVGAGTYVTFFRQTAELERLEKAEKVAKMKRAEMRDLLAERSRSKAQVRTAMSKWRARYKVVPDTLSSPEVVGYLNGLTQRGFESFDISVQGVRRGDAYNHYALRATGRGYFTHLYRFIWKVENNRPFYAVKDLNLSHIDLITESEETGREKLQVMVSFNMSVNAYFGGPEGISPGGDRRVAGGNAAGGNAAGGDAPKTPAARPERPPVPPGVLAKANLETDPFFPIIMEQVPPNTHDRLNLDTADLVSIVGDEAIFKGEQGLRKVGVGDDVYLGQVTEVNATQGRVKAVLNRGGIIDNVEVTLGMEDAYRGVTGTQSASSARDDLRSSQPEETAGSL